MNEISPNSAIADIFLHADKARRDQKAISNVSAEDTAINALAAESGKGLTADEAKKVAKDFEALFLGQMMEQMVPEPKEGGLFSDGEGSDVFRSMMVDEYAKAIAKSGGIGLASHVEKELLGANEAPKRPLNYDVPIGAYERTDEQNQEPLEASNNKGDTI